MATKKKRRPIQDREMRGKREMISAYLRPEIADALRDLSAEKDAPVAHFMREAAEDLLRKYGKRIPKPKR